MYWTSEADLSGFIFGNKADWLFGEQKLQGYFPDVDDFTVEDATEHGFLVN